MTQISEIISISGAAAKIYRGGLSHNGHPSLIIGEINFDNAVKGAKLLGQIELIALKEKNTYLIGPMNGDTWHSYRLVSKSDGSPPFLLEPTSQQHDLKAFEQAGFEVLSTYSSSRALLIDTLTDQPVRNSSLTIAPLEGDTAADLINTIFDFSVHSFAKNAFYKPIEREAFHALYMPLMDAIDRRFVLLAKEATGCGVGFLFGIPDLLDPTGKTIILKTYASQLRGVGHYMVDHFHRIAMQAGYETVIHALMHQDNVSRRRSRQHMAVPFREYALLIKEL